MKGSPDDDIHTENVGGGRGARRGRGRSTRGRNNGGRQQGRGRGRGGRPSDNAELRRSQRGLINIVNQDGSNDEVRERSRVNKKLELLLFTTIILRNEIFLL